MMPRQQPETSPSPARGGMLGFFTSPKGVLIGFLLLVVLVVAGKLGWMFTHMGGWHADDRAHVTVDRVMAQTVPVFYETVGTLQSDYKATMRPETDAVVERVLVKEGQLVKTGQPLLQLRARRQGAQLAQAEAEVVDVKSQLASSQLQLEKAQDDLAAAAARWKLAQVEHTRYDNLLKRDFVSKQEAEQKWAAYEEAKAQYEAAQTQVAIAEEAIDTVRAGLVGARASQRLAQVGVQETVIRAPFDGRVGARRVNPGDYVTSQSEVAEVVAGGALKVEVHVPQRYMADLAAGTHVEFRAEAYEEIIFKGQVRFVSPSVDEASQTLLAKATIGNADGRLKPGQYGRVRLIFGHRFNALVVPEQSIVPLGSKFYVYRVVRIEGKPTASLTEVKTGIRSHGQVEIIQGLSAEDRVISGGIQFLTDGKGLIIDRPKASSDATTQTPQTPQTTGDESTTDKPTADKSTADKPALPTRIEKH
ncbi:MAG: efflux RND transporter periplasmic adaptor subunit [Cyanobacteria bacterium HKST-UBA03]|nr:efflux RND transporter periplasmic adaptor subunit [Cyanobacteria bacterium HKST-UBA03]